MLASCSEKQPELISCTKEFVSDAWENEDAYFDDHKNFIADYFSVNYVADTLYVTTLMHEHCDDDSEGIIDFTDKTIYLKVKQTMASEKYCPEFYKYSYVIYNPGGKKYDVVSVK